MPEGKSIPPFDPTLLPTFQQYKQEHKAWLPDLDAWDYLNLRGADFDLTAAFSKLFWPNFVEVEDCVLLARSYSPQNLAQWQARYPGNPRAVEAMLNHVHISDLYPGIPAGPHSPLPLLEYLAQVLMVCWKHALLELFPDKHFTFSYLTAPEVPSPEISFTRPSNDSGTAGANVPAPLRLSTD